MKNARTATVRTRPKPYPVYVGRGLTAKLPALLKTRTGERRVVIAIDRGLAARIGGKIKRAFTQAGWNTSLKPVPAGEGAKSFTALTGFYHYLLNQGVERRTPLIAVGGGAVGDAVGFAAATYYRGIPLVHVPTTLLAQVDSAIGGKTAVNLPAAKNAVGAFYQPLLVVADTDALKTLPEAEFRAGMAEVVKYGLVFDRAFARWLKSSWTQITKRRDAALARMIHRCASLKASVVSSDERDLSGKRELLNFGHTLGHALESATRYKRFRHGEAVAWGMKAAVDLSQARGWISASDRALARELINRLPLPRWPKALSHAKIIGHLKSDKKVVGSQNVFILLKSIARPVRVRDVSREEIKEALSRIA